MRLTLLLLRHAEAAPAGAGQRDRDRALTRQGRRDAERTGRELARRGFAPDLAVSSGARRADETLDLVLNQTHAEPSQIVAPELYEADEDTLVRWLRRSGGQAGTILMVGHNPSVEALAALIQGRYLGSAAQLSSGFPPGALVVCEMEASDWTGFQPKLAVLRSLLLPELLPDTNGTRSR